MPLKKLKGIPGHIRTSERNPDTDNLGYKGHAIIFKTKNGMYGEVQINTPVIDSTLSVTKTLNYLNSKSAYGGFGLVVPTRIELVSKV